MNTFFKNRLQYINVSSSLIYCTPWKKIFTLQAIYLFIMMTQACDDML